jgi:hypothetical protein
MIAPVGKGSGDFAVALFFFPDVTLVLHGPAVHNLAKGEVIFTFS